MINKKISQQEVSTDVKKCLLCGVLIVNRRGGTRYCSPEHSKRVHYLYYEPEKKTV